MSETLAQARKWRRKGAYCIAFGVLLEVFAGTVVAGAVFTGLVSWWLAVNAITVAGGVYCINCGLTIRRAWEWALPPTSARLN